MLFNSKGWMTHKNRFFVILSLIFQECLDKFVSTFIYRKMTNFKCTESNCANHFKILLRYWTLIHMYIHDIWVVVSESAQASCLAHIHLKHFRFHFHYAVYNANIITHTYTHISLCVHIYVFACIIINFSYFIKSIVWINTLFGCWWTLIN